jgi:putative nucleotidyltransferase with HDIG domain
MNSENIESLFSSLRRLCDEPRLLRLREALRKESELHLVGGTVRDSLSGLAIQDIDCATKFGPDEVRARLQRAGIYCVPTGLKHQTVTAVPLPGEPGIEITTFRGAHMSPGSGVVASESIEIDVLYRDFTINALAYDIEAQRLIDLVGGLRDLSDRLVRCVGDPASRFQEDPLRVLRMVRFACQPGYRLDPDTAAAAPAFAPALAAVSIERIRDELSKMLLSERPQDGMLLLQELGFLSLILPEVARFVGFEQNEYHLHDLFRHTLEVLRKTPPELTLRLAALLHDVGKPDTLSVDAESGFRHFFKHESVGSDISRDLLRRLRYPNKIIDEVCLLVSTHMRPIEAGPGGLRRLLRDTGELFPAWRILKEADASSCKFDPEELRTRLEQFDATIEILRQGPQVSPLKSLALNGKDLMAQGIPESPLIGKILRALHERVLDMPELNTQAALLALLPEIEEQIRSSEADPD